MGDPSKVVFLEEMASVIKEFDLLNNVVNTGRMILEGFETLQVQYFKEYCVNCLLPNAYIV